MTKADIINQIVARTGIEKDAVSIVVEAIMDAIKHDMANGKNIYLRGFGTFLLKKRNEKIGQNINKGISVRIPAHIIPAFKPSKEFAVAVKTNVKVK
jgi:DNA-binding protein HU-beta